MCYYHKGRRSGGTIFHFHDEPQSPVEPQSYNRTVILTVLLENCPQQINSGISHVFQ